MPARHDPKWMMTACVDGHPLSNLTPCFRAWARFQSMFRGVSPSWLAAHIWSSAMRYPAEYIACPVGALGRAIAGSGAER